MINKKIKLSYAPRKWAIPFHENRKRWMVLVVHRRAGKTTAALNFMQLSALKNPNSRYAYIAPTYKQAKNVAWDILKRSSASIPGIEHMESELSVRYPNGSRITLYGADAPDRLRGMGLWGVVFDEYSQQPSKIFSEIIRPTLSDHNGYAIWIGTPKGRNEFYRMYEQAKTDPERFALLLTVDDTNVIPRDEIESARRTMSPDEFSQEWYCSFDAAIKGAYYAEELRLAREQGRIGIVPHILDRKVFTVWDLGVGQALAVGFYQKIGSEMRMIDYWAGKDDEGMIQAITLIHRKPYIYEKHFAPHDIAVRETTSGVSRFETARKLGISFTLIPNLPVSDGIHAGSMLFSRLLIDEAQCRPWLDAIGQYAREWDDERGMFNDKPYHNWTSHAADVHRYAALVEKRMNDIYGYDRWRPRRTESKKINPAR